MNGNTGGTQCKDQIYEGIMTGSKAGKNVFAYLLNETLGFHQIPKITVCINLNQHKIASTRKPSKPTNNFHIKGRAYQSWVYSKCLPAALSCLIQSPLPCICTSKIWPNITEVWSELKVQRNTSDEDHWSQLHISENQESTKVKNMNTRQQVLQKRQRYMWYVQRNRGLCPQDMPYKMATRIK
jgi:hypothetical protein